MFLNVQLGYVCLYYLRPRVPPRSAPELPLELIEVIARTCYKSEEAIGPGTAAQMVRGLLRRNHGAMIEHAHASVRFITDRGVTHEMVRHRIASYAQESTRYCNYSKVKFGKTVASHPPYAPAESNFL